MRKEAIPLDIQEKRAVHMGEAKTEVRGKQLSFSSWGPEVKFTHQYNGNEKKSSSEEPGIGKRAQFSAIFCPAMSRALKDKCPISTVIQRLPYSTTYPWPPFLILSIPLLSLYQGSKGDLRHKGRGNSWSMKVDLRVVSYILKWPLIEALPSALGISESKDVNQKCKLKSEPRATSFHTKAGTQKHPHTLQVTNKPCHI